MTILVLDIKLPPHMGIYRNVTPEHFITGYFQDILLYMIVFIALGYLWYTHHSQSHFIQHTDRNHLWISLVTLMFVALVPFSSSLVNRFTNDTLAELFLSSNMFVIGVLNYLNWAYATKNNRLMIETVSDKYIVEEKKRLLIFPAVSLLAMAAAFVWPAFSPYAFFLAPVIMLLKKR